MWALRTCITLRCEVSSVLDERVVLDVAPLAQFLLTDGADVAVLLLAMLLHVEEPVALEVADLALELDDSGVNALVSGDRGLAGEELVAEVARVGLREHVRHLLVLAQLPRRKELLVAQVALEAGVSPSVELCPMVSKPNVRAKVSNGRTLVAYVHLKFR